MFQQLHTMSSNQMFKLVLHSKPENIEKIEPFVKQVQSYFNISDDLSFNILLVLTEAVNNSILHGNCADPDKCVHVASHMSNHQLYFEVRDEGKGFNPSDVPNPCCPKRIAEPNGRGVFLMRQLSDYLQYRDEGRSVNIVFKIK